MAITHSFVTFKMQARLVIHLAKQDTDPFWHDSDMQGKSSY
jgi:hypothetical protein